MWHDLVVKGRDLRKDQKVSHRICLLQYFVIIIDIIKFKNNKNAIRQLFFYFIYRKTERKYTPLNLLTFATNLC